MVGYEVRLENDGSWTVYEKATDRPAKVEGIELTKLLLRQDAVEVASELERILFDRLLGIAR